MLDFIKKKQEEWVLYIVHLMWTKQDVLYVSLSLQTVSGKLLVFLVLTIVYA